MPVTRLPKGSANKNPALAALYAREKIGKGTHIDVAMFDGTLDFLEHGLMEYIATGKVPQRTMPP
jgi:crotonobetainyl-CoA:carnitine CoA-transferase CaiB-like acyl-CoA transferase